ncbi:MAG: EF-P 5-aminopentanol modification-associated protein YfmF [Eubacteriales bacterium]
MLISRKDISDGVSITAVKTDKFKFNRVFIDFILPLCREHASENAMFSDVLFRGTKLHPDLLSIQRELSSLYGAEADSYVGTCGEAHVITMYAKLMKDKYAIDGTDITRGVLSLLSEIITMPRTENGVFLPEYVESEKEKLSDDIASQINDKDSYAVRRCIEIMCENEAWSVSELGRQKDVEKITPASLYERYKYILSHARTEIFTVGELSLEEAERFARGIFSGVSRGKTPDFSTQVISDVSSVRSVTERQTNINQGRLVLGFRTGKGAYDADFYVLKVLNAVFGGGVMSKLFVNVREKMSLCYYCNSRLYNKGVMIVSSGIDSKNRAAAKNAIMEQLDEIRHGKISEEELSEAKKYIRNSLLSISDGAGAIHSYYLSNLVFGIKDTPEEMIEKTERVSVSDIVHAAEGIKLDTEYFLCGGEEEA